MNRRNIFESVFFSKLFLITLIITNIFHGYNAFSQNGIMQRNLTENLNSALLLNDITWFTRVIGHIATTVESLLPKVANQTKTNSFSQKNRAALLLGLRFLLIGIKEVSVAFEEHLNFYQIRYLHQLSNASNVVGDVRNLLQYWFIYLKIFAQQIYNLFTTYMPEMFFGKCLIHYLMVAYPDSPIYEYPYLLLTEIYSNIQGMMINMATSTISNSTDILNNTITNSTIQITPLECFKSYTMESVSRMFKSYFLGP